MTQVSPFRLGAFALHALLGSGAHGDVFGGLHPASGVPVAVKVLRGEGAREPRVHAAFREEVRAVARLDHPGVVLVFEQGVVGEADAAASGGVLTAGAPWLAMEHAARGTLDQLDEVLAWRDIRGVLLALLAALGHAHARGVLHRDLKPANVLLGAREDLRPAVRLADFGLAFALEQGTPGVRAAGTPAYMAPEQIQGQWRAFSAATDLYGVGCIAWELATGAPPFGNEDVHAIATRHRFAALPPLANRVAVPEGFEAWLHRLLAKAPRERFQRAADAAWALQQLGEPTLAPRNASATAAASPPSAATLDLGALADDEGRLVETSATSVSPGAPSASTMMTTPARVPAPATWRPDKPPFAVTPLHGAGLSLWGLRDTPLTGRDVELDDAWTALSEALGGEQVRAVLLRGEPGDGKSRIARELSERAAELGLAQILKATHGPSPSQGDGLPGMLARRFASQGLAPLALQAHLADELGPLGISGAAVQALASLLRDDGGAGMRPLERWGVIRTVLMALSASRPVIVWLDDAQWGHDATRFVRWLLEEGAFACLVIVTAHVTLTRDEGRAAVSALREHPGVRTIDVGPLSEGAAATLAQRLLGIDMALAHDVARLTGGNPLFVQQLLGSWVVRGDLGLRGTTWSLVRQGAPETLRDAWNVRLEAAIREVPEPVRRVVDAAAVLGQRVDEEEWSALVAELGLPEVGLVRDALIDARLALPEPGAWAFAHGLLREAVLAAASDVEQLHAAAARVLTSRGASLRRVANHHRAAAEHTLAIDADLREVTRLSGAQEVAELERLAEAVERALDEVAAPLDDPRRRQLVLERALAAGAGGRPEEGVALARRALDALTDAASPLEHARAGLVLGDTLRAAGRFDDAERALLDALVRAEDVRALRGRILLALGRVHLLRGEPAQAERRLLEARADLERAADGVNAAEATGRLGDVARLRGRQDEAATWFAEAVARYRALGHVAGEATQLHGLAEAHRLSGRLEEAEAGYRGTIAIERTLGRDSSIPRFNLALCLIAREKAHAALETLEALQVGWERAGRRDMVTYALAGRVCARSMLGDAAGTDALLVRFSEGLQDGCVDIDLAQLAERAMDLWRLRGDPLRARALGAIALSQWNALEAPSDAARVLASLDRLHG